MLGRLRRESRAREAADRLHGLIVARAREPVFYTALGVPDSIDGRFDLVALHAFLVLDALRRQHAAGEVATHLATALFAGFEDALRDLGVSDFGLSRRIKALADAFYGRVAAYATAGGEPRMREAVVRNLYRGNEDHAQQAAVVARYIERARAHVEASALADGLCDFGPLPEA